MTKKQDEREPEVDLGPGAQGDVEHPEQPGEAPAEEQQEESK